MTLRTRRVIFYGLFFVFFPISIGVIFYSQGWRFDFENFSVKKTGAIYIETIPKNVAIKLNNKPIPDQSGLIKSGTLIPDLLPKNYKIEIQKDGYWTYRKNIKVEPTMVSELIDTVLIPQKFEKITAIEKLKGSEIIALNNKRIVVKNPQNKIFYLYKFNELTTAFNINASFNNLLKKSETIENVALHPFNDDRLLIKNANGFYIFDIRKLQIETVFQNDKNNRILAWFANNSTIYIVKCQMSSVKCQNYAIYSYNLITKTENEIIKLPENLSTIVEIKTSDSGSEIGLLGKSGVLSIFNIKDKKFQQITDDAIKFSFSPDSKKLFFINNNGKISVYFIEDWYKNSKKKTGDIVNFSLKNEGLIKNAYWHKDSYHLFVKYVGENENTYVDFMEIDDRSPLNQYPIIAESESNYYNAAENLLYFIQNKTLYKIEMK
jgi:hypothetical protein